MGDDFIAETIKRRIAEKKSMTTEEKSKETNHMAEVAALFGKSLKEEFTVRYEGTTGTATFYPYDFNLEGALRNCCAPTTVLFFLLTGRAEIVKEQVKNCPFCKSEDVGSSKVQAGSNSYHVCCFECGASGPVANSREEAVKLWNRGMDND